MQRFVESGKTPQIRFIRKHGRIIPIVNGKHNPKAARVLNNELQRMDMEVQVAEPGRRVPLADGTWMGQKSTFPEHFRKLGFKTKNQWTSAVQRQKGPAFERLLSSVQKSREFKVATGEIYDNQFKIFRTIDHKVRPIKLKSAEEHEFWAWKPKSK
jgi:hypothetical protein